MSQAREHDVPFFYDFLVETQVPAKEVPGVLKALDAKIASAKRFLEYLNSLSPDQGRDSRSNEAYARIQHELTAPIVDGELFLTLNAEFNHAAFEREDTAANQRRLQQELEQATKVAEEEKNKFKQAVKNLEEKAAKLDGADLAKIEIEKKGQDFLFHFDKVCRWILDIYYDTPPSKYDWENFREQAFTADNGADLRNRVKGIHIPKLFDYQIETGKYVLSTRRLFQAETGGSQSWDVLISTAEDVTAAFESREKYTKAKKLISDNKIKIIQATIDLTQGETIAKTSGPLIHSIMDELVVRDNHIRLINLSDFNDKNQAQHSFHKDSTGKKINNFLREDALANYGASKETGKAGKKGENKAKNPAPAEPQPPKQPEAPVEVAPPPEKLEDINMGMLD